MGFVFLIVLLIWGWAEMSAFILIGAEIGGFLTVLGIFVTAVIGVMLLKQQGLGVLNRIRTEMRAGQPPITSIADSIALVCGGMLMLVPGYVTDATGLMLFIPGIRTLAGIYILQGLGKSRRFTSYVHVDGGFQQNSDFHRHANDHDDIIEGEFKEHGDQAKTLPKDH